MKDMQVLSKFSIVKLCHGIRALANPELVLPKLGCVGKKGSPHFLASMREGSALILFR